MSEIEYELWELDAHRAVPTPDGEPVDPYNQERCSADEADNAFIRDITGTLVDMTPVTMQRIVDAWNLCVDNDNLSECVVVRRADLNSRSVAVTPGIKDAAKGIRAVYDDEDFCGGRMPKKVEIILQAIEAAPTGHGRRVNDKRAITNRAGGFGDLSGMQVDTGRRGQADATETRRRTDAAREGRGRRVFGMVMDDQRIAEIRALMGDIGGVRQIGHADYSDKMMFEVVRGFTDLLAEVERLRGTLATVRGDSNMLQALMEAHGDHHILQLTEALEEHPDGYDGPCQCETCRSYGD